jgi:hypothetical protein
MCVCVFPCLHTLCWLFAVTCFQGNSGVQAVTHTMCSWFICDRIPSISNLIMDIHTLCCRFVLTCSRGNYNVLVDAHTLCCWYDVAANHRIVSDFSCVSTHCAVGLCFKVWWTLSKFWRMRTQCVWAGFYTHCVRFQHSNYLVAHCAAGYDDQETHHCTLLVSSGVRCIQIHHKERVNRLSAYCVDNLSTSKKQQLQTTTKCCNRVWKT